VYSKTQASIGLDDLILTPLNFKVKENFTISSFIYGHEPTNPFFGLFSAKFKSSSMVILLESTTSDYNLPKAEIFASNATF